MAPGRPCSTGIRLLALLLLIPATAAAQATGAISGLITDPSGAAVPDAAIEVVSQTTGLIRMTTTARDGVYLVPLLPPGVYLVKVAREGFSTVVRDGVEFASRPLHLTFGRDDSGDDDSGSAFAHDLAQGRANPDLNAYRGFAVADSTYAESLVAPTWGKTFMLRRDDRRFQGLYVGAGPYFAARGDAAFDASLANLLGSSSEQVIPSASFGVSGSETDQLALAIVGGYRARVPLPWRTGAGGGRRDGMYLAANYRYLQGLRLDAFHAGVRIDTDPKGLIEGQPPTPPLSVVWETSSSGRGLALDFGTAFVVNRWDFGVGVSGLANRITWRAIERHDVTLDSLIAGDAFVHVESRPTGTERISLPATYTGDVAYHRERWSVQAEYAHGLQGNNVNSGVEYRLGTTDVRGGVRYSKGRWYPSGGVGIHVWRHLNVDVAAFGTSTFLERRKRLALAVSLRLERSQMEEIRPSLK